MLACAGLGAGVFAAVQATASNGESSPVAARTHVALKANAARQANPASAPLHASPNVVATNVHCGEVLAASVTLNGDLNCPGNGSALLITKNSINLNLNGFSITGSGFTDFGVQVIGTSDTVQNGVFRGFNTAVAVSGATDVVTKLRVTNSASIGIYDKGTKTKITSNTVSANQTGILLQGTSPTLTGNRVAGNTSIGIFVDFAVTAVLTGNFASSNHSDGIFDEGTDTTMTGNTVDFNHVDGIRVSEPTGAAIDGGTNSASGNGWDTANGGTGIQCLNIVCVSH